MIKAIETVFRGCRFRSRLEARWAVFFSALEIPWVYEPERFVLSDGTWYLPDFWIPINPKIASYPGSGYWVEIKPGPLNADEHRRCANLAKGSGHMVCVLAGQPWPGEFLAQKHSPDGRFYDFSENVKDWEYLAYPAGAACWGQDMDAAFRAARSARFEHGEIPA